MKISIIGQSAFGKSVLEALLEKGEDEIIGVFAPPARDNRPNDPIVDSAVEFGIPTFGFKRLRDQEAVDQFQNLEPELCVMAFVTDIVPMEMINFPVFGTIQYHPSLLPLHRGPSSINWPIIKGETKSGLTIFWPDEGLDTGPVLLQKTVEIDPEETLGGLYFNKLFPLGVQAMVESVDLVRAGKAPKMVQDESKATYEGWCKADDVIVNWSSNAKIIFDMIRGSDPQPGANTVFDGTRLTLYDTSMRSTEYSDSVPGQVIHVNETGIEIAAVGGSIVIGRVRADRGKKIGAVEWAESVGLVVGDLFRN